MSVPTPTSGDAARLVAEAGRLGLVVEANAAWRYVAWLTGMAVATVLYLSTIGLLGNDDSDVLVASAAFAGCVAVLSAALLPGARASRTGFGRRWTASVLTWGLLFATVMLLGMALLRGELAFWLPAAVVTAVPLALGARAEAPA